MELTEALHIAIDSLSRKPSFPPALRAEVAHVLAEHLSELNSQAEDVTVSTISQTEILNLALEANAPEFVLGQIQRLDSTDLAHIATAIAEDKVYVAALNDHLAASAQRYLGIDSWHVPSNQLSLF